MADQLLHQRYRADDEAAATAAIQAVFGVGALTTGGDGALEYRQDSLVDDGVTLTRIASSGVEVRVRAVAAPDLAVLHVREGDARLTQESGTVVLRRGGLAAVCPGGAAELRWDRVEMDVYSFPPASIERLLGFDAQRLRLRCARVQPRSAALTALWHRAAGALGGEVLQQRELFESDLVREQFVDALLAVAVEAFGIAAADEDAPGTEHDALEQAQRFMRQRLGDPITVPDVARAAGVSVRGLQLAFRRAGCEPPLLHLRQLRMAAARGRLTAPDAGRATTVGAVARDLAYTNLGRFSAHYRAAFGEGPTEALRAARAASEARPRA